jgi:microcin C transport system ATP-binding protein
MLFIRQLNAWLPDLTSEISDNVENQVLHDVSLDIKRGQTVALVGESGSGKSLTALTILRLLEENTPIRVTGSILFGEQELLTLPLSRMRTIRGNHISMIFQEPMTSLNPVYSIGNQLVEPLLKHQGLTREQAKKEAIKLLKRTGIPEPEARLNVFPHQLSGGQRQRIMIAMALACRPALLIADEPTTALDVTIQAQILTLIKGIQEEFNMGILLITHDLAMVKKIADIIYIMKNGSIVETGSPEKIFLHPEHSYTKHLMESIPQALVTRTNETEILLKAENLSCHFKLRRGWKRFFKRDIKIIKAVDDISFSIKKGTTCGVVGESGSGKTTIGLALLKLIKSNGQIFFNNQDLADVTGSNLRSLRKKIQIVFQDPYSSLSPRLTVLEIIEEGLRVHQKQLNKDDRRKRVLDVLSEVGLDADVISRYPHEFSGGQRQRIAIARAIILRPELIILDEPTSALDMTIQAQIITLLKSLQHTYNLTYLFISHDLKVIRALSDTILVMKEGKIVEAGPATAVFESPQQPYTRNLLQAALSSFLA